MIPQLKQFLLMAPVSFLQPRYSAILSYFHIAHGARWLVGFLPRTLPLASRRLGVGRALARSTTSRMAL